MFSDACLSVLQAAVMPAFQAAVSALDTLNKADIIEMKTFIKPPALVQLTMEAVCILLQVWIIDLHAAFYDCFSFLPYVATSKHEWVAWAQ
jgi:transcription elongation factor GreA-like protein